MAFTEYAARVIEVLQIDCDGDFDAVCRLLQGARENGWPVFLAGNGGSAATAQHCACDLQSLGLNCYTLLASDSLTRIGNDAGQQRIFADQLFRLPCQAILLAFSISGTSPDVVRLIWKGKELGYITVLFTSTRNRRAADAHFVLRAKTGDYEIAEDVHLVMCHAIKKMLKDGPGLEKGDSPGNETDIGHGRLWFFRNGAGPSSEN